MPRAGFLLGFSVAAVIMLLDQVTKTWVLYGVYGLSFPASIDTIGTRIEITGLFNLVLIWNTGVSFGMFANDGGAARWILIGVALAIVLALSIWLRWADTRLMAVSLGLVIGGALGNVVDRILYGAVVDFLDFHAMGYHWPAFNVADAAIVIGVGLLVLDTFRGQGEVSGDDRQKRQ